MEKYRWSFEAENRVSRNRRPETGDRRPETGDRRPETGDRRPETGDRRPETGDRRPETSKTETPKYFLNDSKNSPHNCFYLTPVERGVQQCRDF